MAGLVPRGCAINNGSSWADREQGVAVRGVGTEIASAGPHLHLDRVGVCLRGANLHLSGFWKVLESTWPALRKIQVSGLPVWKKTKPGSPGRHYLTMSNFRFLGTRWRVLSAQSDACPAVIFVPPPAVVHRSPSASPQRCCMRPAVADGQDRLH